MNIDFVRYSPEIENIDPDIEGLMPSIIDFFQTKARESPTVEGTGQAFRGAHAKSFGLAKAEVQFLRNVPPAYAEGIYAEPGRHGALMPFSSTSGHLGPDGSLLGPGLGCAMKIFDVPGRKMVDDEPDSTTFDFVLKNTSTFIANTAKHYLHTEGVVFDVPSYVARGKAGFNDLLSDFLTGRGNIEKSDWAWDELFAFVRAATQTPVRNPLLSTFSTMGAVRHGDYVAKVRIAPAATSAARVIHRELDLQSRPDVFRPTLVDELQAGSFDFDLQVQLSTDLETMSVNNVTVDWPEDKSSFVTVGRVRLPRQDIGGPDNVERGDALAFNQWRVTDEHRPLGEIMQVRKVYSESAKVRRALNNQPQTEPISADEVLP